MAIFQGATQAHFPFFLSVLAKVVFLFSFVPHRFFDLCSEDVPFFLESPFFGPNFPLPLGNPAPRGLGLSPPKFPVQHAGNFCKLPYRWGS